MFTVSQVWMRLVSLPVIHAAKTHESESVYSSNLRRGRHSLPSQGNAVCRSHTSAVTAVPIGLTCSETSGCVAAGHETGQNSFETFAGLLKVARTSNPRNQRPKMFSTSYLISPSDSIGPYKHWFLGSHFPSVFHRVAVLDVSCASLQLQKAAELRQNPATWHQ